MKPRIRFSRHSAFYAQLLGTMVHGFEADYGPVPHVGKLRELFAEGGADIVQTALYAAAPVHFALINRRDGFFLVGRREGFAWKDLEGSTVIADPGLPPRTMLRRAAQLKGVDWGKVRIVEEGSFEAMAAAFLAGRGDFVQLQAPWPQWLERQGAGRIAALLGEVTPPLAFSTLACPRGFLGTPQARDFMEAYRRSLRWSIETPAGEIARSLARFFPGFAHEELEAGIARYQALGTWDPDPSISRDLYARAAEIFGLPAYEEKVGEVK
jgi:ABC-type nitrate/sulfonate/bicarbonate transport system substrate-binding protein